MPVSNNSGQKRRWRLFRHYKSSNIIALNQMVNYSTYHWTSFSGWSLERVFVIVVCWLEFNRSLDRYLCGGHMIFAYLVSWNTFCNTSTNANSIVRPNFFWFCRKLLDVGISRVKLHWKKITGQSEKLASSFWLSLTWLITLLSWVSVLVKVTTFHLSNWL
jgi:hypothetical protein